MFEFPVSRDFKNKKISQASFNLEPQEILLDKLAKKQAGEIGISERKFEIPLSGNILKILYFACLALISLLFYRTFQLQAIEGDKFSALAEGNKFIIYRVQAVRGVIYDKNLEQLVFNRPSFDLVCYKNRLSENEGEKNKVFKEIALILEEDFESLKNKILNEESPKILISKNVPHQKLIILEIRIREFPGFEIENNTIREYRDGPEFAHLIGYLGKINPEELKENPEAYSITDFIGKEGLEKSYEEILRKNPGKLRIERDALGNEISKEIIQLPEPGESLVLFLDASLQRKIKTELEKKLKEIGSERGAVVALDPKTGGVLALVNYPSFDNNLFSQGISQENWQNLINNPNRPLFNRAIAGRYLTGSSIKPLIAAAALEENLISPEKQIYGSAYIEVPHRYDPEIVYKFRDWKVHGWVDMRKAIADSCNVYFYTIGGGYGDQKGLGPTKIKEYLELFGWTDFTGIDLPGEAKSFVPDIDWKREVLGEGWWDGDTYYLSIGQQYLQITPLTLATSFLPLANGGILYKPQIVQKIIDTSKGLIGVVKEFEPQIVRENFIKPQNLQIVREGMRQTVTAGSATGWLDNLPVKAAAKTGTAETGRPDTYHNWITVFAPYEDPEIVLTVMIENVRGTQATALPLARDILGWYFTEQDNLDKIGD